MTMIVWTAQNRNGELLAEGNPNPHLSYSFCYPYDPEYLRTTRWLFCRTKREIEEHIRKWHDEYRRALAAYPRSLGRRHWHCRPVRMVVSWKPASGRELADFAS
jgi:hypothetical protein